MNYSKAFAIVIRNGRDGVDSISSIDCNVFRVKPGCKNCFISKICHSIPYRPNNRQILIEQLTILARKEKLEKLLEK